MDFATAPIRIQPTMKVWVWVGWWIFGYWRKLMEVRCQPMPGEVSNFLGEVRVHETDQHRHIRMVRLQGTRYS